MLVHMGNLLHKKYIIHFIFLSYILFMQRNHLGASLCNRLE